MFKKSLLSFLVMGMVFSADQPEAAEISVAKTVLGAVGTCKVGVGIGVGGFSTISSKAVSSAAYGLFADKMFSTKDPFSNYVLKTSKDYAAYAVKNRSIWAPNVELNISYVITPLVYARFAISCDVMNKSVKFKAAAAEHNPSKMPVAGSGPIDVFGTDEFAVALNSFTQEAVKKYPEWAGSDKVALSDIRCLKYVEGGSSIVKLRTRSALRVEFGYFLTRDFAMSLAAGAVMHNFKVNYDVNSSGRQIGSGKSKTAFGYIFRLAGEYFFRDFSMCAFVDYSRATKKTDGVKNKFGGVGYGLQARLTF